MCILLVKSVSKNHYNFTNYCLDKIEHIVETSITDLKVNASKIYNYLSTKRGVNEQIMQRSDICVLHLGCVKVA